MKRLIVLCAVLIAASAQAQEPPKRQMLGAPNGRYVLGQIGDRDWSQFLVDTQGGRVWSLVPVYNDKNQIMYWVLKQIKFVTDTGAVWGPEPPPTK